MPANKHNNFTNLGIGIGLRIPHYRHILSQKPTCDWFEIISENYMCDGGRPLEVLDDILEQYKVVQHGVSMYFGSVTAADPEHLKRLKNLVKRTKTPFVSDHLCWGSVDGSYTHDLLPMPYTFEAARKTAKRIKAVSDYLEVPICVENVSSYAEFHQSEMTEWEFLSEVTELADCGILLDVNNIYVSSQNHSFNPYDYLNNVPHHRVGQMHIAGHSKFEKYILDTHDHPVLDPVWKMYAHAIKLCGPTSTLLEWDAHIPSFDEVHREALKAKKFLQAVSHEKNKKLNLLQSQRLMSSVVMRPLTKKWNLNRTWTDGQKTAAVIAPLIKPNDRLTAVERIEIYNKQYWFRLIECFSDDFPGLRGVLGEKKFDALTLAYLNSHPSRSYTLRNLGQFLLPFLEKKPQFTPPKIKKLALDMARFEWAQVLAFDGPANPPLSVENIATLTDPAKLKLAVQPYVQLLHLSYPLDHFLTALKRKDAAMRREASNAIDEKMPAKKRHNIRLPKPLETFLAVHRFENILFYKRLTPEAFTTLTHLRQGATLEKALEKALLASKNPHQDWPTLIQTWFNEWTQLGWFCKPK